MNRASVDNKSAETVRAIWLSGFVDGLIALPILCLVAGYIAVKAGCLPAIGHWFVQTNELHKAEAIVVLAGGGPERLCHGIELYKRGLAPAIYYTGDKPIETRSDFMDSEQALNFALRYGMPKEKIKFLPSTSTFEDGKSIATLVKIQKIRSVILVTSWYHTRRAANVLRHCLAGADCVVYITSSGGLSFSPENWWKDEEGLVAVQNEIIKTALYWRRYGITP